MKKLCTLLLAAGLVFGAATGASAIDFKAKGQWLMGFTGSDTNLIHSTRVDGAKHNTNTDDKFQAVQRVRLQLDAVASESLSGTVYFEIGNTNWGNANQGGALGADGKIIKLKRAYIDWLVPDTTLKFRMGIQGVTLPNAAGGSAIMDTDAAAITASYKVSDALSVTALWARPLNDNYTTSSAGAPANRQGYLDNLDLFSLMVPVTLDGFSITPWAMIGMKGANSMEGVDGVWQRYGEGETIGTADGNLPYSLYPYPGMNPQNIGGTGKAYGTLFWAGLPFTITAFDPLNIEVDLNYGYAEPMGRYDAMKNGVVKRSSTLRQGWLAKALVEYKMDWGVPGIFGWYGSGDDGNPKNGSERMPSIVPMGTFTSFMGDGNLGWVWNDFAVDYSGTWGIGLQVADITCMENLSHTFRVAYWGGTNSTSMVKYMNSATSWSDGWGSGTNPYLTTNDGLLEFNLVNNYKMYENFDINLELGYIANFVDNSTWKKAGVRDTTFQKQDAWKAQLVFAYSF